MWAFYGHAENQEYYTCLDEDHPAAECSGEEYDRQVSVRSRRLSREIQDSSNGSRLRLWKTELQRFVDEIAMPVTVCHFPPGTSKWNKIEHRLFSFITQNWRGKPLVSHEVIVNLIAATTTESGLRVHAEIDASEYPLGK